MPKNRIFQKKYYFTKNRNELEEALEAAHDRRRNLLLDSVTKEERLLQGNMILEEEVQETRKRVEDELLNAKQLAHNAKLGCFLGEKKMWFSEKFNFRIFEISFQLTGPLNLNHFEP